MNVSPCTRIPCLHNWRHVPRMSFATRRFLMVSSLTNDEGDMDKGFERAKREYQQVFNRDSTWKKGPFLVCDKVSEAAFEMWAQKQESHWKLAWEPSTLEEDYVGGENDGTGFCWLYGDPDDIHERTVAFVSAQLIFLLDRAGAFPHIDLTNSIRRKLTLRHKEPDWSSMPRSKEIDAMPSIVLEVASGNESLRELKREIMEWVEGDSLANLAIGLNIKVKSPSKTKPQRMKLQAFWMRRGDKDVSDIIDFSYGKGDYKIRVTARDIFEDKIPEGVEEFMELDLSLLQDRLKQLLQIG